MGEDGCNRFDSRSPFFAVDPGWRTPCPTAGRSCEEAEPPGCSVLQAGPLAVHLSLTKGQEALSCRPAVAARDGGDLVRGGARGS